MNTFGSIRVIESVYAEKDGDPVTVRRTWRERLFTRPWRPWRATRTYVPKVPCAFTMPNGTMVMHPALMREMRRFTGVRTDVS